MSKAKRQPFLKPVCIPDGMLPTDFFIVAPDGTVVPLCPDVLGVDWSTIRAKMADVNSSGMLTLADIRREDDTEH